MLTPDVEKAVASHESFVPRKLVHRLSISEVLMTDARRTGRNTYICGAQWPRWHVFYENRPFGFDTALIEETLRQATILVCHKFYDVPFDYHFLLLRMRFAIGHQCAMSQIEPEELSLNLRFDRIRYQGKRLFACRSRAQLKARGQTIGYASADARIVTPPVYQRMRGATMPELDVSVEGRAKGRADGRADISAEARAGVRADISAEGPAGVRLVGEFPDDGAPATGPIPAPAVGKTSAWNVCIGPPTSAFHWPLLVDTSNPVFFDHPLDHTPGMLLLESMRQAVRLALADPSADFDSLDAKFTSFVEIGLPADIRLASGAELPEPRSRFRLSVVQGDAECVVAEVTVAEDHPEA
ncbi:AfsA-related hotdog domain-containing protein [Saxibacter everestensis]|uniref:AfsA-related hotdog domain-containing protein n=1 Tax=Saxibacter everestensis TaxID=2909229 RepID=A0ABY8QV13_9MICO|nr:AfsA-related hotdog domain-containing protein [Brevibacteriaceae bacterium ZFBP1038]